MIMCFNLSPLADHGNYFLAEKRIREMRAIVTAGGSGIGRQIADSLSARGDDVFICDIDPASIIDRPYKGSVLADVSDETSVDNFMSQAFESMGGVDLLVNTAGIAGPTGPIEQLTLAEWRQCLSVTLDGTFLCCSHAAPVMKAQGSGLIVNFSSTAGMFGYPNRSPYATAKWGVIGLTKSLAMELGPKGIRVNAICPGAVAGERMDQVVANEAKASNREEREIEEIYKRSSSLRTFVSAEDIANMILFLSSPAGEKISGQALAVDGHTEFLTA